MKHPIVKLQSAGWGQQADLAAGDADVQSLPIWLGPVLLCPTMEKKKQAGGGGAQVDD